MYPNCMSHIMILAQAVIQIFCSQGCVTIQKCQSQKREIIQPHIYKILPKVNQVIYTLDKMYMPNIIILAQAFLQIFCSQGSIGLQCKSRKRGITLQWQVWGKEKRYRSFYFLCTCHVLKILSLIIFDRMQSVTDAHTDKHTDGQPQTNVPPQFF